MLGVLRARASLRPGLPLIADSYGWIVGRQNWNGRWLRTDNTAVGIYGVARSESACIRRRNLAKQPFLTAAS